MLELLDIIGAAVKLASGEGQPSLKYALQIAALSPQKSVKQNVRAAEVLGRYVASNLPDRETLAQELAANGSGMVYGTMLDACYWAERCERAGWLRPYETVPQGYDAWVRWRDGLRHILAGHGFGYKVISFAGLIYAPLECELCPIDRHVLARLDARTRNGKPRAGSPQQRGVYLSIEREVIAERDAAGKANIPLGLWHWLRWEQWRELSGASRAWGDGLATHAGLSCRNYHPAA